MKPSRSLLSRVARANSVLFATLTGVVIACSASGSSGDDCTFAVGALRQCSAAGATGTPIGGGNGTTTTDGGKAGVEAPAPGAGTGTGTSGGELSALEAQEMINQCVAVGAGLELGSCVRTHAGNCPEIQKCFAGGIKPPKVDSGSQTEDGGVSLKDAKADATKKDATTPPPAGCAPGSISGFSPTTRVGNVPTKQCTSAEISTFQTCLNNGTGLGTCISNAGATCGGCIATDETAAAYGPLIVVGGSKLVLNYNGCAEKYAGATCGQSLASLDQCVAYTCDPNCAGATDAEIQQCQKDSVAGPCTSYLTPAQTCYQNNQTQIDANCDQQASETQNQMIVRLATLFCGGKL